MTRRPKRTENPDQLLTERPCCGSRSCDCHREENGTFNERPKRIDKAVILDLAGYFTGGSATDGLKDHLEKLSEGGNKKLLLNCERLVHLNSSGLGLLIRMHSNYVRRGGQFKFCKVDKRIENIFVITKLSLVFDVYPNEAKALASFS